MSFLFTSTEARHQQIEQSTYDSLKFDSGIENKCIASSFDFQIFYKSDVFYQWWKCLREYKSQYTPIKKMNRLYLYCNHAGILAVCSWSIVNPA